MGCAARGPYACIQARARCEGSGQQHAAPAAAGERGRSAAGHYRERKTMSRVFVNIGLSLDGYMAPEGMTLEHWDNPGYKNWAAKWEALMGWILNQQYFR